MTSLTAPFGEWRKAHMRRAMHSAGHSPKGHHRFYTATCMMNYSIYRYAILLVILLSSIAPLSAQSQWAYEQGQMPVLNVEEIWAGVGEGLDYTDTRRPETPQRPRAERDFPDTPDWDGSIFPTGTRKVLRVVLLLVVIVLLTYLGYRLMGNVVLNPARDLAEGGDLHIEVERLTSNLEDVALDQYVNRALAQSDYRLAVRLYFLQVLQLLAAQKHIKWKKDKTNRDYLRELSQHPERNTIRELMHLFERNWYGESQLDELSFDVAQRQYRALLARLQMG